MSADRQVAYAEVYFDQTFDELANDDAKFQGSSSTPSIRAARARPPGRGHDVRRRADLGSEFIGLVFAAFILLLAFGSVLAMGLPIVTALFGLGIGATLGGIASQVVETPDWAPPSRP